MTSDALDPVSCADPLEAASEVFHALATAVGDLRVYGPGHPRSVGSVEQAGSELVRYFEAVPGTRHLTFTIRRDRPEYRRAPLRDCTARDARLVASLGSDGGAGIQILRDITDDQLRDLVRWLAGREQGAARSEATPPDENARTGPDPDVGFRSITKETARRLRSLERGARSDEVVATDLDALGGIDVAKATFRQLLASHRALISGLESGGSLKASVLEEAASRATRLVVESGAGHLPELARSYFDDFTFHHSVNVCLLTTEVASRFVSDERLLRDLSLAALLHDIGKIFLPREVLHKAGRLTDAEFELVKTHPVRGAELLLELEGVDPLSIEIAFGHHRHSGARSYPESRHGVTGHVFTRLVSVVDVFEALTAVRSYKQGLSASRAFEIMVRMPGLEDRRDLLRLLWDTIGPYPNGTFVELTTGERGMVIAQNDRFPRLPTIRLLRDGAGCPLAEAVDIDLGDLDRSRDAGAPTPALSIRGPIVVQGPDVDPLEADLQDAPTRILGHSVYDDTALMEREG